MSDPLTELETVNNKDLERFAEALGLHGQDADLFYESYYNLDSRDVEMDLCWLEW